MAVLHFFSSKFHSNIYSILFGQEARVEAEQGVKKQHIKRLLLLQLCNKYSNPHMCEPQYT